MTNKDNLENFIKESNKRSLQLPQRREFKTSNGMQVYIKDPVTNDVDIEYVFETIEKLVPRHLFYNVELIDDIIHEISHSIEDFAGDEIYGDSLVKYEFLGKRKKLFHLLKNENFHVFEEDFLNPHYSREFDEFLYKEVGYPLLANLTMGLFVSPYATTALKEYFAVGFEEYFLKDRKYLKTLCPHLFQKIDFISNIQPED